MPPRHARPRGPRNPNPPIECDIDECQQWFASHVPSDWFNGPPSVRVDKDEILVAGELNLSPKSDASTDESHGDKTDRDEPDREGTGPVSSSFEADVARFREATRGQRMQLAEAAQRVWGRSVSWAVRGPEAEIRFTTQAVPVMTRLRIDERQVLDTLIDAGVARSRSEALAWCVHQVGQHQEEWIGKLRAAMAEVERIRAQGPGA